MPTCFYLVCPTDCLEYTINKKFKYENYFYTALGNSFVFDAKTIKHIKNIIREHHIKEIYFVLSIDNKIILDALGANKFSDIIGLHNFYKDIKRQRKRSMLSLKRGNIQFAILSYHLNKKIKELELQLSDLSNIPIKIRGKIYNKNENTFSNIYSNLVCLEKHHLN